MTFTPEESIAVVPQGAIMSFSGQIADIPDGFALCDGNNGTPDLTDSFIQGAGGTLNPNDTGGADTQSVNVSVSDSAEVNFRNNETNQTASDNRLSAVGNGRIGTPDFDNGGTELATGQSFNSHSGRSAVVNVNGSGSDNFDNRPAFYALAYIMKT